MCCTNKCVFNGLLNVAMPVISRRYCGSAFQSVVSAMLKALLPAMVDRVNGTHSRLCSWECRPLDGTYDTIVSSCKYAGAAPCIVLYTVITTLNCIVMLGSVL